MKLWHVSQSANQDYDTFDSMVVVAEDANQAVLSHPRGGPDDIIPLRWNGHTWAGFLRGEWDDDWSDHTWARPDECVAHCIGEAVPEMKPGTVVIASFNAG